MADKKEVDAEKGKEQKKEKKEENQKESKEKKKEVKEKNKNKNKNDQKEKKEKNEKDKKKDYNDFDMEQANAKKIVEIGSLITAPTKLDGWYITQLISEGTFAKIFIGQNASIDQYYAIKVESRLTSIDFISHEVGVLRFLNYPKDIPHIPKCVGYVKEITLCYFAMTLFGENLRDLKLKCPEQRFLRGTWSRIGIQVLYALKMIHEKGFIHRDIKPNNLMMGTPDDAKRWRIVHIIGFGFSRQWAWSPDKSGKMFARPLRSKVQFRGSLNYASPNAHFCSELGRRDDLWSLLFTLVDLNDRLPWFGEKNHNVLVKQKMDSSIILAKMPKQFERLVEHLLEITCLQRPNYHMFYNVLNEILLASGQNPASKYTFEETELSEKELNHRKVANWEEAKGDFFTLDSIKINNFEQCLKKDDWKHWNMDKFQFMDNDLMEETAFVDFEKELKKKGVAKPEMKLEIKMKPTDKNKINLYNEFKSIQLVETYAMQYDYNQKRANERYLLEKKHNIFKQKAEERNYLAEKEHCDKREKLKDLEKDMIKAATDGGISDEDKNCEVNMAEIGDSEEAMKQARFEAVRNLKKKEKQMM